MSRLRRKLRIDSRSAIALLPGLVVLCSCSREIPPPSPQIIHSPVNRLLFAGDVMFSRAVRRSMLAARDPAFPFRKIACTLKQADIAFVNLESPFSDRGRYFEDGLIFHSAPGAIAGLELAGIGIVSTANNHARDCGPYGVGFTVDWLQAHHIAALGSSQSEDATHRGSYPRAQRRSLRIPWLHVRSAERQLARHRHPHCARGPVTPGRGRDSAPQAMRCSHRLYAPWCGVSVEA